jgi:hypothetical protein
MTRARWAAVLLGGLTVAGLLQSPSAATVAPGCTSPRSTFIGGTLVGYPDGRALDAHVGVSAGYLDAAGRFHAVLPDGSPSPTGNADYSWIDKLNPTVPAEGTTDPAATRTWGQCVWAGVTDFYIEVYPKDPQDPDPAVPQKTDKARFGSTAYYSGKVTAGQTVNVALRAPVTWQAGAGNTGGLQGYVTYRGRAVPAAAITRVRAFPGPGAACGVEGYSAAADQLTSSADGQRTFYRLDYLAGGQCGAANQSYSLQITCHLVCGATDRTFTRRIAVAKAKWPRLDVAFT